MRVFLVLLCLVLASKVNASDMVVIHLVDVQVDALKNALEAGKIDYQLLGDNKIKVEGRVVSAVTDILKKHQIKRDSRPSAVLSERWTKEVEKGIKYHHIHYEEKCMNGVVRIYWEKTKTFMGMEVIGNAEKPLSSNDTSGEYKCP